MPAVLLAWVRENSPLLQVRAAGLHVAPLRHLIHLLKYEERPDLAPDLARYLAATLAGPDGGRCGRRLMRLHQYHCMPSGASGAMPRLSCWPTG